MLSVSYAECHYAQCRYTECRGATDNLRTSYDHYLGRGAHLFYSENALAYYTTLVTTYTIYF